MALLNPLPSSIIEPYIADKRRVFRSRLVVTGSYTFINDTALCVYMGWSTQSFTPGHIKFNLTTGAGSSPSVDLFVATTPNPPNASGSLTGQTLTVVSTTTTTTGLTTTGVKQNSGAFSNSVNAGVHVWACVHFTFASTAPVATGLAYDWNCGEVLGTTSAGTIAVSGTLTGALVSAGTSSISHNLILTLD